MSQHDMDVANASGATVRADINSALQALASNSSGASGPSTTYAYQFWCDTTNGLMKQRNSANSAWLTLWELGVNYPAFPSGTLMLFQQTSAPTGWTKQTTHNDKALRVVSGTASSGGATAFSSVFGSGKTTGGHSITQAELPNCSFTVNDSGHYHTYHDTYYPGGSNVVSYNAGSQTYNSAAHTSTATTGITVDSGGSDTAHTHTLSLDPYYVDVIIASKD